MPSRTGTSALSLAVRSSYWGDYAGDFLQSVDEVHAGGMCVAHGNEAVVELVFVVAASTTKRFWMPSLPSTTVRSDIMLIGKP